MAQSLKQNLTSAYLEAARHLSPKKSRRCIVAYVESYDDVAFWRMLLAEFETDEYYFRVMLPSNKSLTKGKKMALNNLFRAEQFGKSMIACVDSDYDFLMQGTTAMSRQLINSPYVLQTYAYAIENYQCYAESLHEVCVQATLNDRPVIDFPAFMCHYSQIVYPLFLWNIWFYRKRDLNSFPMYEFHDCVRLQEVNLRRPEHTLQCLQQAVEAKLKRLRSRYPHLTDKVRALGDELAQLRLTPETTYLYMQGHHVMDNVVMKLLTPVCTQLRREREADIKRLAEHNTQLRNELTCYENSLVNVAVMLRKNDGYKDLYLYRWMRRDVRKFLERVEKENEKEKNR